MTRKKLRTSREVYDQLRWDPRLDARSVIIGYDSRRDGMQEMALADFEPGGDIPWHRIWYFRNERERLWDREQRLDRLVGPGSVLDTAPEPSPPPKRQAKVVETPGSELTPLPVYRFDAAAREWTVASGPVPERAPPSALTVVTYNVLLSRPGEDSLDTPRRTRDLLQLLERTQADVIALQEVTPPVLAELLAQPWVREAYCASDSPAAETVTPYGILLLSRVPLVRLSQHRFTRDKRILVGELETAAGRLAVAVLHLMSDMASGAEILRSQHLDVLLHGIIGREALPGSPDWLVMGDFNFGDDGPQERFAEAQLVDLWKMLRPDVPGLTFDPVRNPLAKLTSTSGRSRRLDRILFRGAHPAWEPRDISLLGEEAPPSDHFGLRCRLELQRVSHGKARRGEDKRERARQVAPVHRSAVVLIPPEELWPAIQRVRTEHDKHVSRWMPHMTLLYGFVPEEHFEAAAELASEALASFEPFTVRLEKLEHFRHRGSATLWARPDSRPPRRLSDVQQALQAAFPQCDEQSRHSGSGFTPHLSLGQSDLRSATETLATWQRDWQPLEFEVREVQLISRRGDEPFEVRYSVSLGGGWRKSTPRGDSLQRWLDANAAPTAEESARREEAVAHVEEACSAVLGTTQEHGPSVHLLGSSALGVALPGSDVDLLCLGPDSLPRARFFEEVALLLSSTGVLTRSRAVLDAANPVLKLELGDTRVDLQYAQLPPGVPLTAPEEVDSAVQLRLEPDSQRALVGYLEAGELLARVHDTPGEEQFRRVLRAVRAWARARGVSANALGYLGGFSWAVLVAHACVHAPEAARGDTSALLEHFFSMYARWKWPEPVALTEMARIYRPERRDLMPVLTILPPVANSARNVSRSTLAVLRDEWLRGEALTKNARSGTGTWEALFEPLNPLSQGEHFLLIGMRARNEDELATCMGWLDGFISGLVVDLDTRTNMRVRPLPGHRKLSTEEGPASAVMIALDRPGSVELDPILQLFRVYFFDRWTERPEGSELSYAVVPRAKLAEHLEQTR